MPRAPRSEGQGGSRKAAPKPAPKPKPSALATKPATADSAPATPAQDTTAPAPTERMVGVRMIYGQHAGQVLSVTAARAAELCNGPVQQAEPVALPPTSQRETR